MAPLNLIKCFHVAIASAVSQDSLNLDQDLGHSLNLDQILIPEPDFLPIPDSRIQEV
jgi:hypothetical protein